MAKIIYNGEYEKKAITDQFVENLGGMPEKDPDVIYLDADLMFAFGAGLWDLGDKYPERVSAVVSLRQIWLEQQLQCQ